MESMRKCKNNDSTCLLHCINICHFYRKQFEPSAWRPRTKTTSSRHGKCECMKNMHDHFKLCLFPLVEMNLIPIKHFLSVPNNDFRTYRY